MSKGGGNRFEMNIAEITRIVYVSVSKMKDISKALVYKFDPSKDGDLPKYTILYILLQTGQ